jgi:hypothetical protein
MSTRNHHKRGEFGAATGAEARSMLITNPALFFREARPEKNRTSSGNSGRF